MFRIGVLSLVIVGVSFGVSCRRKLPGTTQETYEQQGVAPTLPSLQPNAGIRLMDLSVGQHLNCGVTLDGRVLAWGVGDYVEIPNFTVKWILCRDEGFTAVAEDGTSYHGNPEVVTSLVNGQIPLREFSGSAITADAFGEMDVWDMDLDGTTYSDMSNKTILPFKFKKIAGGDWGVCGIRTDDSMFCEVSEPLAGKFVDLAVGWRHLCAIDTKGAVTCHGSNTHGQATPPKGEFMQVSAGRFHSCAISDTGELSCWGAGHGANDCREPSWSCGQSVVPKGKWSRVGAGAFHTCALRDDGHIVCWGRNDRGQARAPQAPEVDESPLRCGLGSDDPDGVAPLLCWNSTESAAEAPFEPKVVHMEGGESNFCALLEDGRVACMRGPADNGEPLPRMRVPDLRFSTIHADDKLACGRTHEGKPICFTVAGWALPPWNPDAVDVYPASLATLSLTKDGFIDARGHDWAKMGVPPGSYKKLCGGGQWTTSTTNPQPINRRGLFACGLSKDGEVHCWGDAPRPILGRFEDIACGNAFVCGVQHDRHALCTERTGEPKKGAAGSRFRQISASGYEVEGALEELDDNGYGVDGVPMTFGEIVPDTPKGPYSTVWLGANLHCGQRDSRTVCWGKGKDLLRAPAAVQRTRGTSAGKAKKSP